MHTPDALVLQGLHQVKVMPLVRFRGTMQQTVRHALIRMQRLLYLNNAAAKPVNVCTVLLARLKPNTLYAGAKTRIVERSSLADTFARTYRRRSNP